MDGFPTPGEHALSVRVGEQTRDYLLHVPTCAGTNCPPLPLVIVFHGGGGTARLAAIATGWSDKAEDVGFFVAYPEGVRPDYSRRPSFLRNPQFFNVGSGIGYAEQVGADDRGFVRTLLDDLCGRLPIDRRRVYATGFSNGASMAFQTAMDSSERIAAVGAVSGHLWRRSPTPREPVSLIYIVGTADPLNPIDGGVVMSPWGKPESRPPIADTVETWAAWIGCDPKPHVGEERAGVSRMRYDSDNSDTVVDFVTIAGAGHVWPGGPDILAERIAGRSTDRLNATDEIWCFFGQHPKA